MLVHALLCAREGKCARPDCTAEVHQMKTALRRMEAHAVGCKVGANLPGRRGGCVTCKRWLQLQKLRDRFTRQLLQASSRTRGATSRAPPKGDEGPPLMRRHVTYIMSSFSSDDDEEGAMDLALLPQLVEGELQVQRRRREAKHAGGSQSVGGSSRNALQCEPPEERGGAEEEKDRHCGMDGCTRAAWHTGVCQVAHSGARSRRGAHAEVAPAAPAKPSAGGGKASGRGEKEATSKASKAGKAAAAAEEPEEVVGKVARKRKQRAPADDDEEEDGHLQRLIVDGARLAQTPNLKGTLSGRKWAKNPGTAPAGDTSASTVTVDLFPPSVGMHIAVDGARSVCAELPDAWTSIATAPSPARSNVAEVAAVHADGRCDATLVCNCEGEKCVRSRCGVGALVRGLTASQRQIVCSGCRHANLPHALPTLRCAACDKLLAEGAKYRRAPPVGDSHSDTALCEGCYAKLFAPASRDDLLERLEDGSAKLEKSAFALLTWSPEEEREFDDYVQCTECTRWYHFVCAMYPAPEQLPRQWRIEAQLYVCPRCIQSVPAAGKAASPFAKLRTLQSRRASELPTCLLSDTIEAHLREELKAAKVKPLSPIFVRVVSRKNLLFPAIKELKQRYGASYAHEFPYLSQAIFTFQKVEGRDVVLFAVYVQEYDADCPPPNTNRTYISYVDSVRYLATEQPAGARTAVYHGVLAGYLKHAAACGFEHAHLWVAPPEEGSEYVFHCRPADGRAPMSTGVLQAWYEKMLARAQQRGIVAKVDSLQQHVKALTSVRDFPLFDGDFFPDRNGSLQTNDDPHPQTWQLRLDQQL